MKIEETAVVSLRPSAILAAENKPKMQFMSVTCDHMVKTEAEGPWCDPIQMEPASVSNGRREASSQTIASTPGVSG
jgi:hypothetical protein